MPARRPQVHGTLSGSKCAPSRWTAGTSISQGAGGGQRVAGWGGLVKGGEGKKGENSHLKNSHWVPVRHVWALHLNHPSPLYQWSRGPRGAASACIRLVGWNLRLRRGSFAQNFPRTPAPIEPSQSCENKLLQKNCRWRCSHGRPDPAEGEHGLRVKLLSAFPQTTSRWQQSTTQVGTILGLFPTPLGLWGPGILCPQPLPLQISHPS